MHTRTLVSPLARRLVAGPAGLTVLADPYLGCSSARSVFTRRLVGEELNTRR